ncbi:uncharacterized protein AMSG_10337 [Thecamonas trahens ATCC 50062]|uniref:Uncharacterized protein n=1 Tax=Thecamonas trahens ATCC 50062 TaxID=461836 RepID=A0A0L0DPW0_THETB|nr:hypothetical protein AMSG_10337 [Thecamonas trahens ATCC 50062]KNC54344.1 hypothetical protein AMSG_10337 [Thecamonas trahens ATCC 50062]|eukprot:XP_013753800.1 hypothetical protein AMSG_10337 [Thecamonas trahens ATCC 50062]
MMQAKQQELEAEIANLKKQLAHSQVSTSTTARATNSDTVTALHDSNKVMWSEIRKLQKESALMRSVAVVTATFLAAVFKGQNPLRAAVTAGEVAMGRNSSALLSPRTGAALASNSMVSLPLTSAISSLVDSILPSESSKNSSDRMATAKGSSIDELDDSPQLENEMSVPKAGTGSSESSSPGGPSPTGKHDADNELDLVVDVGMPSPSRDAKTPISLPSAMAPPPSTSDSLLSDDVAELLTSDVMNMVVADPAALATLSPFIQTPALFGDSNLSGLSPIELGDPLAGAAPGAMLPADGNAPLSLPSPSVLGTMSNSVPFMSPPSTGGVSHVRPPADNEPPAKRAKALNAEAVTRDKHSSSQWSQLQQEAIVRLTNHLLTKIADEIENRGGVRGVVGPGDAGVITPDMLRSIPNSQEFSSCMTDRPLAFLLSIITWLGTFLKQ